MSINIPGKKRQWIQPNTSDVLGTIYASKNIDLTTNVGKVRVGQRLYLNTGTGDVAELNSYPAGFRIFNNGTNQIWTIAGSSGTGYVFNNGALTLTSSFSKVTTSGAPTNIDSTLSDIEVLDGNLYVTANDSKAYYVGSGGSWSNISSGLGGAGFFNGLCSYKGRMYAIKAGIVITSWSSSGGTPGSPATIGNAYTVSISTDATNQVITWMRAASNYIWIGTVNLQGGKGYVYRWDGISANWNNTYRLESAGALSCVIKDDVPYIMDTNGTLLAFNGGTFIELATLNRLTNKNLFNPFNKTAQRYIHPNGMAVINGNICALIDGAYFDAAKPNNSQELTIPSGVWEYTKETGLYPKHSFGLMKSGGTLNDHGQTRIFGAGALSEIITGQSAFTTDGTFIAGASYYTDASTTTSGIFYNNRNDDSQKAAWLITPKLYSSTVTDTFERVIARFRKFLNSSDRIVIKSRSIESDFTQITGTWTSTTTFTTSTDVTGMVGYEVEVVQGAGSGKCSHIVSVSGSGTYTVTVDETYAGCTSGTMLCRVQQWNKNGVYAAQTRSSYPFMTQNKSQSSNWIQYKIWMQFTGRDELEDLYIINQTNMKDITN